MNIHPIVVHFPIALLTLYAVAEILPLSKWFPSLPFASLKVAFLTIGAIGIFFAIFTGSVAQGLISDESTRKIVSVHESFAYATTYIFCAILIGYIIRWIFDKRPFLLGNSISRLSFLKSISNFILRRWIVISLASIGLAAVVLTGALGGIIVYGQNMDPFTKFIYNILLK